MRLVLSKPIIFRFKCFGKINKRCDRSEGKSMAGEVVGAAPPDGGWGWLVALGAALVQMQVESSMADV